MYVPGSAVLAWASCCSIVCLTTRANRQSTCCGWKRGYTRKRRSPYTRGLVFSVSRHLAHTSTTRSVCSWKSVSSEEAGLRERDHGPGAPRHHGRLRVHVGELSLLS